jgi:membrane protease YdiL (CAAX protease family)
VTDLRTNRVLFVWLLLAGLFGSLIGVPWAIAVLRHPAAGGPADPRVVWLWAVAEALLLLAPASAVGVWLGNEVGLGPRLLRELLSRMPGGRAHLRRGLLPTTLVGLTAGVLGFLSQNSIPPSALLPGLDNPNTFEILLRALGAALTEEILFRLGLMTFFVWVIRSVVKRPAIHVPSLWIGNVLAALVFAAAHFPQLTFFQTHAWCLLIPFVMVSGGAAMIMGWLYMRYSLISAIVAHFIVDLVVYVIPRLLAAIA